MSFTPGDFNAGESSITHRKGGQVVPRPFWTWGEQKIYWILPSSGLICGVRWFDTVAEPTGISETSLSNHLTPLNNQEKGRIHFNRGGRLRSRRKSVAPAGNRTTIPLFFSPKSIRYNHAIRTPGKYYDEPRETPVRAPNSSPPAPFIHASAPLTLADSVRPRIEPRCWGNTNVVNTG